MTRKGLIIGVVGAGIVLIVLVAAYGSHSSTPSTNIKPANTSATPNPLSYSGEDLLTNIGVTSDQVNNLEQALEQYFSAENISPNLVSFDSVQKTGMDKNAATPVWTVEFMVQLDSKDAYKAKMNYFNLSGIRLYLYGLDGKLLYDSQDIGGSPEI